MALDPCLVSQVKDADVRKYLKSNRDLVRMIWQYSRKMYIDKLDKDGKPIGFDAAVSNTATDLGIPEHWVLEAFNLPKGPLRKISNELYRRQDARKNAVNMAKSRIDDLAANGAGGFVRHYLGTAAALPRRVLTFGHGPVFPVTHAGDLMFRPNAMPAYWRNYYRAWSFASKAVHGRLLERMQSDPEYARARAAGADVDPSRGPSGAIGGSGGWARRAWDSLKILRFELFKQEMQRIQNPSPWFRKSLKDKWENLSADEKLATEKEIARSINHATGVMSPDEMGLGVIERAMFAPKLTESKVMKSVVDPATTAVTYLKLATGQEVPFSERYVAAMRTRNAAQYLATYGTLLALNRTLQGESVNAGMSWENRLKGDWMRFKVGPYVINTRGSREVIGFLGRLIAIEQAGHQGIEGKYRLKRQFGSEDDIKALQLAISQYAEYKENPALGLAREVVTGRDIFGRPLPASIAGHETPYASIMERPGRPRYEWPELVGAHLPIYMGGATREVYQGFRERGFTASQALEVVRGLANNPDVLAEAVGAGVFEAIGGGFYKEKPQEGGGSQ